VCVSVCVCECVCMLAKVRGLIGTCGQDDLCMCVCVRVCLCVSVRASKGQGTQRYMWQR